MADISAKDVQALRMKTGAGMMDCKKALIEANGNEEAAVKLLREKGLATAAKKADRIAAEGLIDILVEGDTAVMIEVNSETDFVAKNADFQAFVKGCLATIIKTGAKDVADLLTKTFAGSDITVDAMLKEKISTIGENLSIRRFVVVSGVLSTYNHHNKGVTGVIVKYEADKAKAESEDFKEFAKNITFQIAAMSPLYLDRASVPADVVANELEIIKTQIKNDPANAKKPEAVIEKMSTGKIGKFYETNCLLEQAYVKEEAVSVKGYIDSFSKTFGSPVSVSAYVKFEKGEGLQKREDNFAEEIAKLTQK